MAVLLLLLLVISHATEKGRCSLPPLTWFKDHPLDNRKPETAPALTLMANDASSCASFCSDMPSCSAFFHNPETQVCDLHHTVFMKSSRMVDAPGYVYYRIMSDDCPIKKCYYLLRDGDEYLCVFFFQKSPNSFQESKAMCESQEGHLPILDTQKKNVMVARMIERNTEDPRDFYNCFLGANQKPGSTQFIWRNGKPVPSPGSPGNLWNLPRPDSLPIRDCMVLYFKLRSPTKGWNSKLCTDLASSVVCELKPRRGP